MLAATYDAVTVCEGTPTSTSKICQPWRFKVLFAFVYLRNNLHMGCLVMVGLLIQSGSDLASTADCLKVMTAWLSKVLS